MTQKDLKAAVDKLKMLQNSKAALEQMTDADCLELFGIPRTQALTNTNSALTKVEQDILREQHPLTEIDRILYEIAAKYLITVQERGDLATRYRDSDDFIEVPVWGLEAVLKETYNAGRQSEKAAQSSDEEDTPVPAEELSVGTTEKMEKLTDIIAGLSERGLWTEDEVMDTLLNVFEIEELSEMGYADRVNDFLESYAP